MPKESRKRSWLGAVTSRFLPATKRDVEQLGDLIKMKAVELKAELETIKKNNAEALGEIATKLQTLNETVARLEEQLANADLPEDAVVTLGEVKSQSQALADIIPGTTEPPAEG